MVIGLSGGSIFVKNCVTGVPSPTCVTDAPNIALINDDFPVPVTPATSTFGFSTFLTQSSKDCLNVSTIEPMSSTISCSTTPAGSVVILDQIYPIFFFAPSCCLRNWLSFFLYLFRVTKQMWSTNSGNFLCQTKGIYSNFANSCEKL